MLPLFGVGWWRYGLLKGMRREKGKEKGNKGKPFFFFFFFSVTITGNFSAMGKYKKCPIQRLTS